MILIEQWLSGREFAKDDQLAAQMVNFTYFIADDLEKRAWLVDPAWDVRALYQLVRARGFELDGALLTHWHPDHAGGDFLGLRAEGAADLRELTGCSLYAHKAEAPWLEQWAGIKALDLTPFEADEVLSLGSVQARCVHAPGHTPGSTCYLVTDDGAPTEAGSLFTGDVLFVGACGRVDLPGSDPEEMKRTLLERLAELPAETIVYPGHDYGPKPTSTLGEERATNPYLQSATW